MAENVNHQIRNIIMEALEVGNCTRKEILEKINQGLPESNSLASGVISGVFKYMQDYGEIKSVSRGVYQIGDGKDNKDIQSKVRRLVNRFRKGLDRAYTVNLLQLEEYDKEFVARIQSIVNNFDTEMEAAFSEYGEVGKTEIVQESPEEEKQEAGRILEEIQEGSKK